MVKHWKALRRLWTPFTESKASVHGASACFYMVISILPASVLFLSALPYLPISSETWNDWVHHLLPGPFLPIAAYVLDLVHENPSPALLSLSAGITLWSASKGILSITDGLNAVLQIPPNHGYLYRRLQAMGEFLLFMVVALLLLVGQSLFSGLFTTVFLGVLFTLLYRFLPGRIIPLRFCALGGFPAAAGWMFFSFLFSIYVNHFTSFQRLYGGMGLLLLACIWLHICLNLVLCGAVFAKLLWKGDYHPISILKEAFS